MDREAMDLQQADRKTNHKKQPAPGLIAPGADLFILLHFQNCALRSAFFQFDDSHPHVLQES